MPNECVITNTKIHKKQIETIKSSKFYSILNRQKV